MPASSPTPSNWWMFHGDPAHSGVATGSNITSQNVGTPAFQLLHRIQLQGSILSVPALVDGFAYVGTANSHLAVGANGGSFYKINLATGAIVQSYTWSISVHERDSHGFTGMGCTPAVVGGMVYFSAFNGCVYCLDQNTLQPVWVTKLRHADLAHNQPVENTYNDDPGDPYPPPPVAGWSSPLVVNGSVYVGVGEGENANAFSFVYCLDATTGNVKWLFCTNKFAPLSQIADPQNSPNVIPAAAIAPGTVVPPGFTVSTDPLVTMGASVWTGIAYDADLNRIFCSTGNPHPDGSLFPNGTPGYTNGVLALDASTGKFVGFTQFPPNSSYRNSDIDVDVGGSPTLFTRNGTRYLAVGCKNGCLMMLNAATLAIVQTRQLLPYMNDGSQIPTVDPHAPPTPASAPSTNPPNFGPDAPTNFQRSFTNEESNGNLQENFYGTYSTPAVHAGLGKLFMGVGGNNYHLISPGIDSDTTPFMRALDWGTLADAWPLTTDDPPRYAKATPPMFTNYGESGLSVPAVVNDVVFMATSGVNLYAFNAADGTFLWSDNLGEQTSGLNGGYGYCLGAAISGDYVVAGALVRGVTPAAGSSIEPLDGGVLKIYGLVSGTTGTP